MHLLVTRRAWVSGWRGPALALAWWWSLAGCATTAPLPEAQRVIPVNGVPGPLCQNLGTVIGESEARGWGSGATTAEQLAAEATGDAMQRAASRGATHIFLSPVTLRQKDGAPSGATLTGVAFRCPSGA
jgi:hypothetical protein